MNWLGSTTIASLWRMCPRMGRKIWFWMLTMMILTRRLDFLLFAYVIQFRICTQTLAILGRTSRVWWMITRGRQKHILNWNPLAIWRNLLNNIHNSRRWQVLNSKNIYWNKFKGLSPNMFNWWANWVGWWPMEISWKFLNLSRTLLWPMVITKRALILWENFFKIRKPMIS